MRRLDGRLGWWALLLLAAVALAPASARAQEPTVAGATALPGGDNPLGLGLRVGASNGLTMKYFFSEAHAFETSVGVGFIGGSAVQSEVTYLYHIYLNRNRRFTMPLYIGAGSRISVWPEEGRYIGAGSKGAVGFGFFAPLGVAFNLRRVPIELFAELATGFGVVSQSGDLGLLLDLSMGVRFYL